MNDRFKFRAWDELNKIMHYDFQFIRDWSNGGWIIFQSDKQKLGWNASDKFTLNVYPNPYFAEQLKIQQCTGLKDKNGKLIYEGDVLQSDEYPFKNEKGYNYAAEVLWDDASATFYYYTFRISDNVVGRSTGNTGELNEYEDWKVIGNIYEDSHLIENPNNLC